ncbi:MAG: FixH family protein [gamma proteobacterium symbiont of Bathyaustriella thionipta]|nr:FixH family protein [gamma proteobacterium symbiont of Bathyaustriella thionipta]MCU7949146.1 FixH family protein [gamma proteobacterium symbiont of Bathyaustriella thionipta]MCU7952236.1 FixH family protein [gamma proteobacterium symbiont of Bathyaustriella thionipta]MCU7955785.1 FixH family protein [gamma proteobacterium symbiont of Bathyaustriella thionipta]MCU7965604.1 FixH family protein [gamma proteobacterium symbiont of Bathyaustriella thionipta]
MSSKNINVTSTNKKQVWYKSPWLIGWLLLVIVVLAVNAFMIFQSINNFPGLVVDDFYDRGQDYEENINKKLENNEKWDTAFQLPEVYLNKPVTINFTIKDKTGTLSSVEKMTMFAYRPSDAKKDFSEPMTLAENKKNYQATMTFDSKGKWDLLASTVIDGTEVNYAKSIFVKD